MIESFEGLRTQAYLPTPHDVPTIGYGHTDGVKLGDTCTPEQADEYLAVLAEREKQANKKLALYTAVVAGCAILAIPARRSDERVQMGDY